MDAAFECGRMGSAAYQHGSLKEAIAYFTMGIKQAPPAKKALTSRLMKDRCDCLWEMGNFDEACADMKKALDLDPKCQMGRFNGLPPEVSLLVIIHP